MTTSKASPPEVTLVAMNLSGRFAGREIRRFGHAVVGGVLTEKNVDVMFGQQANFKPKLPEHYSLVGAGTKAFLAYNKARLKACDERQFRAKLRDLQFAGRLPMHYLPLQNFVLTKFRTRHSSPFDFIGVSWLSDASQGRTRNLSTFRKLMLFASDVAALEELPLVLAGTFNITLEEAADCLPKGYCCYGYLPHNARRRLRAADFFICPQSVRLENVRPIVCANLQLDSITALNQSRPATTKDCPNADHIWLNPEDAFYCDPVRATLVAEPQAGDAKMHANKIATDEERYEDTIDRWEDVRAVSLEGDASTVSVTPKQEIVSHQTGAHTYGLLKKLPSCPELHEDLSAENSTTCYMS